MGNIFTVIKNVFSTPINDPTLLINAKSIVGLKINTGYIEHSDSITRIAKDSICFSNTSMASAPLQGEVSVKHFFRPISNQYNLGSCVANSTADSVEAEQARAKNINPNSIEDISRLFIYWNARNNQNPPASDIDKGTYIALAFDAIKRYGVPSEKTWPYNMSKVAERPSPLSYATAYKVKVNNYYSINSTGDNRVADVIRALSAGHSVVFGTKINDPFRAIKGKAIIGPPSGGYIGGHAMVIVGWSATQNAFEIRNSWGEDWGDLGYTYFTPEYIKASITHDLFVATL